EAAAGVPVAAAGAVPPAAVDLGGALDGAQLGGVLAAAAAVELEVPAHRSAPRRRRMASILRAAFTQSWRTSVASPPSAMALSMSSASSMPRASRRPVTLTP